MISDVINCPDNKDNPLIHTLKDILNNINLI